MSKIPFWKIKREVHRLRRGSRDMAADLVRKLYFRRYYDLVTRKEIRRTVGMLPLGREVALYLIFPASGVLASHLFMLTELRRAGISPIVVSNLPLSVEDRDKLRHNAARIIERPNIGYDFGGYRDGVLEIADNLPALERVWLVNDSVWLVPQPVSWFDQARAMDKDFVAATSSFSILRKTILGPRRFDISNYREITWKHEPNNRNFHYASYALCFNQAILRDPGFLAYWKKLDIRNDKKRTVRRGEIGLTQWIVTHGYTHAATHEIDGLDKELAALSNAEIDRIARELVIFRETKLEALKPKVLLTDSDTEMGRAERIGLILTAVARHGSAYALFGYNLRNHKFSFLKKSPLRLSADGPDQLLDIVEGLPGEDCMNIAREARTFCGLQSIEQ